MHFISFNQSINAIMKYILINLLFMAAVSVNGQNRSHLINGRAKFEIWHEAKN